MIGVLRKERGGVLARQSDMFASFRSVPDRGKRFRHCGVPVVVHRNVFWPCEDSTPLLRSIGPLEGERVLDVGTGCGVVGIFCALNGACNVTLIDWNREALLDAEQNSVLNGVESLVDVRYSDMFSDVGTSERFDLITANLPFMNMEAKDVVESAIWDSDLRANRIFLSRVRDFLSPRGRVYVTQANFGAVEEVRALACESGWILREVASHEGETGDSFYAFELESV